MYENELSRTKLSIRSEAKSEVKANCKATRKPTVAVISQRPITDSDS